MSDTLEMGAFKKDEKNNITRWDTERTVLRLSSRKQNPEGKCSKIASGAVVSQTSSNPCLEV